MLNRLRYFPLALICVSIAFAQAPDVKTAAKKPAVTKTSATKPASKSAASKAAASALPARASGNPSAPIHLDVFSDYQCPACKDFYLTSQRRLIEDYCKTGKVYIIHHDFPLPIPQ